METLEKAAFHALNYRQSLSIYSRLTFYLILHSVAIFRYVQKMTG